MPLLQSPSAQAISRDRFAPRRVGQVFELGGAPVMRNRRRAFRENRSR